MARRFYGFAAAAAAVVFAAACNETPPSAPQDAPSFGKAVSPNACLFTGNPSLSNSAGSYFQTNADRKAAAAWITAMQAGYTASGPAGARDAGYSLLALTGAASRDPSRAGAVDIGETMVKQAVNCMYDTKNATDFGGWPDDGQYDFSAALDAPNGGAFFVRGGDTDPTSLPVVGNRASLSTGTDPAGGNVSGMAPPADSTWKQILANNDQKRILIYGEPVPDGFDWKLIGRNTTFSPHVVVALCQAVHPGQEYNAADVVFQESVGSLGFQPNAICGTLPSSFALGGYGHGGFGLVNRFVAMAGRMLTPEPLHAAVLATTIGGSASGAKKDEFTVLNLPAVDLKFTVQPPRRVKVNSGRFGVTVNVAIPDAAHHPAGGITVGLGTTTNNGTGTGIFQVTSGAPAGYNACNPADSWVVPPTATTLTTVGTDGTSQATNAVFTDLCFTKTGSVQIVATSVAAGNSAAGKGTAISASSTVNP